MRFHALLICASLSCFGNAAAQDDEVLPEVVIPALPAMAEDAQGFVPPGWKLEYSAQGDLDGDHRRDLLLVLRMQDPHNLIRNDGLGQRNSTATRACLRWRWRATAAIAWPCRTAS